MNSALPQIKNLSIREQSLDTLREAILSGELKPGQALTETDLARQLGVSRAPIREALRILNSEGLAETIPYHGTTVRRLTKTDIEEIYSMRILLETYAMEQVIQKRGSAELQRLRDIVDHMVSAGDSGDLIAVNALDRDFHDALIEMSGDSLLHSMWLVVAMKVRQVMALVNRRNTDLTQVARKHFPLLDAMEVGDVAGAKAILREHIATAGDLIAEDWVEP
ncbi:MAG: GntR family transcriptional regulator [Chloroflexi bacterium]|nr:GntR family transcriptional regulator [Chloroflexota bacterium]